MSRCVCVCVCVCARARVRVRVRVRVKMKPVFGGVLLVEAIEPTARVR
jgi:hypothetical protein